MTPVNVRSMTRRGPLPLSVQKHKSFSTCVLADASPQPLAPTSESRMKPAPRWRPEIRLEAEGVSVRTIQELISAMPGQPLALRVSQSERMGLASRFRARRAAAFNRALIIGVPSSAKLTRPLSNAASHNAERRRPLWTFSRSLSSHSDQGIMCDALSSSRFGLAMTCWLTVIRLPTSSWAKTLSSSWKTARDHPVMPADVRLWHFAEVSCARVISGAKGTSTPVTRCRRMTQRGHPDLNFGH